MENAEKLPGPVILDFEPISCSMTMTRSLDQGSALPSSLSMSLRLADGDEVRTSDERMLNDAQWAITFYENGSGNQFTELHNAIGMINYYEEWHSDFDDIDGTSEACHAWANLDSRTFEVLRDMALAGKLPSSLRLHVHGIGYGWEPDGSGKVWDVTAHKNAPVSSIEIGASFVKAAAAPAWDGADAASVPTPVPEGAELKALLAAAKTIQQGNARLGWLLALVAVTAAVLMFR